MAFLERGDVTDDDLVKATQYEAAVLAASGGMLVKSIPVLS